MNEPYITMVGNLTADPEVRTTQNGAKVTNFTIACTPSTLTDGEWVDGETIFMAVSAWKKLGENIAKHVKKGERVVVTGHLGCRRYERKDGTEVTSFQISANAVGNELLYGRR